MTDLRSLRYIWWAGGFVTVYVVLDLLCGPPARHWTINPVWHPAAGLALFAVLQGGLRMVAPLLLAALLAALAMPIVADRLHLSIALGMMPLISYMGVAWLIRRGALPASLLPEAFGVHVEGMLSKAPQLFLVLGAGTLHSALARLAAIAT